LSFKTDNVAAVDWSTMVFGLASHSSVLGSEFFEYYNDFDFPDKQYE